MTSIFEPVWSFLYLFQFTGGFPCKKAISETDIEFCPLSWPRLILPWAIVNVIQAPVFAFCWFHHGFDFMKRVNSSFDLISYALTNAQGIYLIFFFCFYNLKFRHDICQNQSLLASFIKNSRENSRLYFQYIFMVLLSLIGAILIPTNIIYHLDLDYGSALSLIIRIVLFISITIQGALSMSIVIGFVIVFCEQSQTIMHCIDCMIIEEVNVDRCLDALGAFETVTKSVQRQVLVQTVAGLFAILGFVFYGFSFFLSQYYLNFGLTLNFISSIAWAFWIGHVMYLMNMQSEDLKSKYKLLKRHIMGQDGEGRIKDLVLFQIDEFQGFSACGYFYLGKPLISSLTANLLTYLVILIQFKLSEAQ